MLTRPLSFGNLCITISFYSRIMRYPIVPCGVFLLATDFSFAYLSLNLNYIRINKPNRQKTAQGMGLTSLSLPFLQNFDPLSSDCLSGIEHQFLSPQAYGITKSSAQILFLFTLELFLPCFLSLFAQDMTRQAP